MAAQIEQFESSESFSEADMETVGFESAELASVESQLEETMESISVESVAEGVEAYMEGADIERRSPSSYVVQRLAKAHAVLIKQAVKKITANPRTRVKLQAACRKGPAAVAQLLTPMLGKGLPSYLKWLPLTFCPPIVAKLYPAICKQAGLKPEEIPVQPEFWGALASLGVTFLGSYLATRR